jgi:hypothetical protein
MYASNYTTRMRPTTLLLAFITFHAHGQYLAEGRYLHREGTSNTYGIAADTEGNIFVGGQVSDNTDFDPDTGEAIVEVIGSADGYVCKLGPSGQFQWVARFGGDESQVEWVQDVVTDAAGNVYVVGCFGGLADFDPGDGVTQLSGGQQDGYLVKLSPSGELIWVKEVGGSGTDGLFGVTLSDAGDIVVSGYADTQAAVDGIPLISTQRGGLVASFQPDGTLNWARVLPGNNGRNVTDVSVGPDGGIHGVGIFSGTMDLDPGPNSFQVVSAGVDDGFYFKLDAAGDFLWGGRFGGPLEDWCYDMDVNAAGEMFLAGHFRGAATMGNGTDLTNITAVTASDALIAKIDADGAVAWVHGIPGNGRSHSVRIMANGDALYNGYVLETADFDPGPGIAEVANAGSTDMFLARYTSGGDFASVLVVGGENGQTGRGLYVDDADVIHAAGSSFGEIDLDPGPGVLADTSSSTASFYVRLAEAGPNAVQEQATFSAFYPNPVRAGQALTTGFGTGHVRLSDSAGRVCSDLGVITGDRPITVDLPEGAYLLEWNNGRMQRVQRFMVVH